MHPDYRALREHAGVVSRTDRGRLRLRGADRLTYLHGLLSNDVLALAPGEGRYATLLTPQGRMITDMRVFELGDCALIDLPIEVAPAVGEHLDRFVITEDVTVEDVTREWAQLGLYGPAAGSILEAISSSGAAPLHVLPGGDLGVEGKELIATSATADALLAALVGAGAFPVSLATTEITRVEAGIPRFLADMDTTTIPLEAGIEDRAISLTKGCYVGQEVIIRVLHRGGGRVARKLVGLTAGATPIEPGSVLTASGREIGRVTSAVLSPLMAQWIALAYVQRDFVAPDTRLEVMTVTGAAPAVVTVLPFRARLPVP
jgi:folate-binding protein YgfZ